MKKLSFTQKMIVSLVLGVAIGLGFLWIRHTADAGTWSIIDNLLFKDITAEGATDAIGLFFIGGKIFINLLQLVIVPMVFTSITLAMVHITDTKKLGRISFKTIKGFLITSIAALFFASLVGYTLMQANLFAVEGLEIATAQTKVGGNPLSIILSVFPNNLVAAFSTNTGVLAVVFLAVVLGLILNQFPELATIKKLIEEMNKVISVFLHFIIQKFAPICVFLLLVRTFASYGINYLKPAAVYMIATAITLFLFLVFGYALFVRLFAKVNPMPFVQKINKVAIFGFSTSSSAATLPLNMQVTEEELGVEKDICSFTLPLGMTINMNGTAIMQVIATVFVASSAGYTLSFTNILTVSVLALIASVGTPAAPGAGAVILFTILSGMGYVNDAALATYALILAINRPIEMLVTCLNVVGDSATAVYVAASEGTLNKNVYHQK